MDTDRRNNAYALLNKHEVKMVEYWPGSFFALLWTETKWSCMKTQNKREDRQYPAILTEQADIIIKVK